jgi:hypothetical protein
MKLTIIEPSTIILQGVINGFKVINSKGKIYFERDFEKSVGECKINIPDVGEYDLRLNGRPMNLTILPLEKSKKVINLPPTSKNLSETLGDYDLKFRDTFEGSPASISTKDKKIYINKKFAELPVYVQKFIYFHELGHRFFFDETACDLYATREMLKRGYNCSGCVRTLRDVLTRNPEAMKRFNAVLGQLNN